MMHAHPPILAAALVIATTSTISVGHDGGNKAKLLAVPVYTTVNAVVPQCTPILEKDMSGDIWFLGCPTWACPGAPSDECQSSEDDQAQTWSCVCRDAGVAVVLCQGVVAFDDFGEVIDWWCVKRNCGWACTENAAPPGAGEFYACDC